MKTMNKPILIPLPSYGFDPTEASIVWRLLTQSGFEVVFAIPEGQKAEGDKRMITGEGLGLFKHLLKARKDAVDAYNQMCRSKGFINPIKYEDIAVKDYYLTYPGLTIEDEVKSYLKNTSQFIRGTKPVFRDSPHKLKYGFFVRDRNYLSARWPGDIYSFTFEFIKMLNG